jgi:uncharacterized protein (TIGR03437 family)
VTAVGGTEFNEGNGAYWASANTANGGSALSWIPEIAWNDSVERNALAATGGGASEFFAKPFWQTGPGVPSDSARDLPDVAFASSPDHDGYEIYTGGAFQVVGGTSCASPVFAGIVALLNQYVAAHGSPAPSGLGNINSTLYRLAQVTGDVFHDVTTGNNTVNCVQSSPDCVNDQLGYNAGAGYDLATGLGSVDAWRLVTEWASAATAATTVTTLTADPASFLLSDTVQLTATVTGVAAAASPTGTVAFFTTTGPLGTANLAAGGQTATLSLTGAQLAAGTGTVTALYGGDGLFNTSAATTTATPILPASGPLVVPSVTPMPVTGQESGGITTWVYGVSLIEKAGVATTLTKFTIDGQSQPLFFWDDTYIAANGTVTTGTISEYGTGVPAPGNHVFHFEGADMAGNNPWSQDLTVPFVLSTGAASPSLEPSIALTGIPTTISQDPTQNPACQWSFQLILQEQAGFEVDLLELTWSTGNYAADGIQQLFGTTQLAPYGMLRANICRGGAAGSDTYSLAGVAENIGLAVANASLTFQGPASNPATLSVTPAAVNLSTADSSQPAGATLNLNFAGGAPKWTAQILPASLASSWLTVSPLSGSGSAHLQLQAAAGLSNGAYQAIVAIQPSGANPQSVTVPVTFVVGAANTLSIEQAFNAASESNTYAPGMTMTVVGSQLAPASQQASGVPLPLNMQGVSATVNGVAAPLFLVSPTQLNIQIPYETTLGTAVLAINNNGKVASFPLPVTIAAPGVFAAADGSLLPSSTGRQGQEVVAYVTGAGDNTPALVTGAAPPAGIPLTLLPQPILPVEVTVGGIPATLVFDGTPSGEVGVTQINFIIPASVPTGVQPVVVTVGGVASSPVTLNVTAANQMP